MLALGRPREKGSKRHAIVCRRNLAIAGLSHAIIHFAPEEMQMIKTIVIGAGVMGASVAYRLAQAGATVTVLEATRIGGGTSGIGFAL